MNGQPVVVLVHGAFAESASWNRVLTRLHERGLTAIAAPNPLRDLESDAAYVRDVVASTGRPVILVAHSYGGMVITRAAAGDPNVRALVYVCGFAPEPGESAFLLAGKFEGGSLGTALTAYPLAGGGNDLRIAEEKFHQQFCADVEAGEARLMAATQRPATERALTDTLVGEPAWRGKPSWFVIGELDRNIPAEAQRFMAERASSRGTREVPGGSHAIPVSRPDVVVAAVRDAADHLST